MVIYLFMYRSLERTICYGFIINDCSPVASFGRTITFVAWTMRQIPKNGYFSLIIRKREDCLHLPQSVTMWKPILHSAQMGVIIILHLYCYCIGLHRRPLCENRIEVTSICTLFRNKRFELKLIVQRNASKFAIFYV